MISPDSNITGFLDRMPDAMRYEHASREVDDTAMRLAGRIPPNSRVLDVGCGSGAITSILKEVTGAVIIGVEPDSERAQKARERGLKVINAYFSTDIAKEHGPFDFVVFADVLEHLANPAAVVFLAKESLKPEGAILASVPNAAHLYSRIDLLRGIFRYDECGIMDATHLRWFTTDSIKRFFERLGFEIVYQDYTVFSSIPDYHTRKPFCWLEPELRKQVLRRLAKWKPGLFAVQHVVEARVNSRQTPELKHA
jgi:methionine biosynthesis protein MetW